MDRQYTKVEGDDASEQVPSPEIVDKGRAPPEDRSACECIQELVDCVDGESESCRHFTQERCPNPTKLCEICKYIKEWGIPGALGTYSAASAGAALGTLIEDLNGDGLPEIIRQFFGIKKFFKCPMGIHT